MKCEFRKPSAAVVVLEKFYSMPNRLAASTSPYLLQHAHNPVDWFPWETEALEKAVSENKPILVSIGYSACHWCHVMEHNCFEDEAIAEVMNEHFVCIKVDREERPDVDNLYMDALHLMGIQGGWPLNVFLTPDQLPFYGGTYFPPEHWMNILQQIARAHAEKPLELQEIGRRNQQGLAVSDHQRFRYSPVKREIKEIIAAGMQALLKTYDLDWGGFGQAPKFPMPCVYRYLLHLAVVHPGTQARDMALHSLEKIALGGIHDQLGGGFARYSVDAEWRVPHFEKMLYDNAQLLSLYSIAWQESGKEVFQHAADGIIKFINNELSHSDGGFFSALDADSEGEEGSYYVWARQELTELLGPDFEAFSRFYDLPEAGNFEHGKSVLRSFQAEEDYLKTLPEKDRDQQKELLKRSREKLLHARSQRERPGLDDKIICSWNALMISGLCEAYRVFGNPEYLQRAEEAAKFICAEMLQEGNGLKRIWKNGKAHTTGFLDDYAHLIIALCNLGEVTGNAFYFIEGEKLADFTIRHFYDETDGLFFYSPDFAEWLVARKKETGDNVIPSSNAQMAMALNRLGRLMHRSDYLESSSRMTSAIMGMLNGDLRYVSQWMQLLLLQEFPPADVVLYGENTNGFRKTAHDLYLPGLLVRKAFPEEEKAADFPSGKAAAIVCTGNHCLPPAATEENLAAMLRTFRQE